MRPHAILFDIDGTLVDTGGAGGDSWRRAFRELYEVDADVKLFSEVGEPDPQVGRRTFTGVFGREPEPAEFARLMHVRLKHVREAVFESPGYRVLPGVESTLERLAEVGILLGLTTGNVEGAAHAKLERGNLNRFFSVGGYGSDSDHRGELTRIGIERAERVLGMAVDTCRVLIVGDTPRDVEAAHYAGATSVAVATGHYTVAQLVDAGAHHVLETLEESIPGTLEEVTV